jgi:hypothetical protein
MSASMPLHRDVHYEGCFSGPAGINGVLGGFIGCLLGIILGMAAVSAVPDSVAPLAGAAVWIGSTVLGAVLLRERRYAIRLRVDRLDILSRRGARSIPYEEIRFIDASARLGTFKGGEWKNARVRITTVDGRTTSIGIDRERAVRLVRELQQWCPRAGGIHLDDTEWLPDDPASSTEARHRLRRILLERFLIGLTLGGGWLALLVVLTVVVITDGRHKSSGARLHDWSQLAIASMAIPFAHRTYRRGARAWTRRKLRALG